MFILELVLSFQFVDIPHPTPALEGGSQVEFCIYLLGGREGGHSHHLQHILGSPVFRNSRMKGGTQDLSLPVPYPDQERRTWDRSDIRETKAYKYVL